jgi:hypothetical protein
MAWLDSGKQGPAPTPPPSIDPSINNPGGGKTTPGTPPLPNVNPTGVIADGKGGFIDVATGAPVNADGTPIDQSGGETTGGGHWEYDENNDPVWVPD